jgi:hypothetical protein
MKILAVLLLLNFIVTGEAIGQDTKIQYGLPTLHLIGQQTLSPAYSCRPAEEFQQGYQKTALFLSEYSKRRNSPDLLFEGACRSDDSFDVSTAGDDMSLIADLGPGVEIEGVTAHLAFNLRNVASPAAYSKFTQSAKVILNHTYAVLINKSRIRGLFVFTVVGYEKNTKVDIKYAVKGYQIINQVEESKGFDWEQKNSY